MSWSVQTAGDCNLGRSCGASKNLVTQCRWTTSVAGNCRLTSALNTDRSSLKESCAREGGRTRPRPAKRKYFRRNRATNEFEMARRRPLGQRSLPSRKKTDESHAVASKPRCSRIIARAAPPPSALVERCETLMIRSSPFTPKEEMRCRSSFYLER